MILKNEYHNIIFTGDFIKYLTTITINFVNYLLRCKEKRRLLELHLEICFYSVIETLVPHFLYLQNSPFKIFYKNTSSVI